MRIVWRYDRDANSDLNDVDGITGKRMDMKMGMRMAGTKIVGMHIGIKLQ
jgi:hypothetical protein